MTYASAGRAALVAALLASCEPSSAGLDPATSAETRTIEALPCEILEPGHYVLAGDLRGAPGEGGVVVRAADVTVDLRGFELFGGEETGVGVMVSEGSSGFRLENGRVVGWGLDGVDAGAIAGGHFVGVEASRNGGDGIQGGAGSRLERCDASFNAGGRGIEVGDRSVLAACTANGNAHGGIYAGNRSELTDCSAAGNTYGDGIRVGADATLRGCRAERNYRGGITAGDRAALADCVVSSNATAGIRVDADATLLDCVAEATQDGDGVASGDRGRFERCRTADNYHAGFRVGLACRLENCSSVNNDGGALVAGEGTEAPGLVTE